MYSAKRQHRGDAGPVVAGSLCVRHRVVVRPDNDHPAVVRSSAFIGNDVSRRRIHISNPHGGFDSRPCSMRASRLPPSDWLTATAGMLDWLANVPKNRPSKLLKTIAPTAPALRNSIHLFLEGYDAALYQRDPALQSFGRNVLLERAARVGKNAGGTAVDGQRNRNRPRRVGEHRPTLESSSTPALSRLTLKSWSDVSYPRSVQPCAQVIGGLQAPGLRRSPWDCTVLGKLPASVE